MHCKEKSITTDRIRLRQFTTDDTSKLLKILQEDGVLDYFPSRGRALEIKDVEKMIQSVKKHWMRYFYGLWAVELISTAELIGRAGLNYIDPTDEIEIDFILNKIYWNQGLATEIGNALLQFAFVERQFTALIGIVHLKNFASQKVLHKIGMSNTGIQEYFGMKCYRYQITREEFKRE